LVALVFLVRGLDLFSKVRHEMSLTPTPQPVMANVMRVTPDPNQPTPEPLIKTGAEGEEVKKIQQRLMDLGFYASTIDGQFGPATRDAVMAFQRQHGLEVDGVIGPSTKEWLYSSAANHAVITPTPAPTKEPTAAPTQNPSLPLLVNKQYPVAESYQAPELVKMTDVCDLNLVKIKYDDTLANREATQALMAMLKAAHADGITVWQISAGYRTYQMQQGLMDAQVNDYMRGNNLSRADAESAAKLTVAVPGTSEHHTGLAFDVTVPGVSFKGTEQARWLSAHCWDYGFIIRYEEDKQDITGFLAEPWHIRYVGKAHSIPMRDQGLCLEEYIQLKQGS
jgi:D-alanyl-D-alanine carboxypeptidase